MLSHLGLRSRMAASYVLVSAAAVLLVEAALLAVMVPRVRSADQAAQQAQERLAQAEQGLVQLKVKSLATNLASIVAKAASAGEDDHPGRSDQALITDAAQVGLTDATGRGTGGSGTEEKDSIVRVVADPGGRIIDVSPAQVYAPSSDLPQPARAGAPKDGQRATPGGAVYWATAPIQFGRNEKNQRTIGVAYVEISPGNSGSGGQGAADEPTVAPGDAPQATEAVTDPKLQPASASSGGTTIASLVVPGIVALVLLIPVGAIFGLLSTGRLIRRIRRLSDGTSEMAEGDLRVRVPVSSGDEVGRLEQAFNSMAERLAAAVAEQRAAAGAEARRAERSRIARELHDSISQELFSVSVVAVGMRKALEPGSVLQEQAASMERSLARTMREMRALLMELRPVQLEDAGLAAALEELCRAYEARLGIPVTAHLDPVPLDAAAEHAVLRVVQEAVGNAIRHGEPSSIEVRLVAVRGRAEVTVRDDGRGFDPRDAGRSHGMGLELMRERLRELGGVVEVASAPGRGTTVRAWLTVKAGEPVT